MQLETAEGQQCCGLDQQRVQYAGNRNRVRAFQQRSYYISVRIKNAAGEVLGTLITDGIFIDTEDPVISVSPMETMPISDWYGSLSTGRIIVNVADNSGIGTYEYSIGTAPGDRDVMNWKLGQDSVGTFSVEGYQEDVVYYANARATGSGWFCF